MLMHVSGDSPLTWLAHRSTAGCQNNRDDGVEEEVSRGYTLLRGGHAPQIRLQSKLSVLHHQIPGCAVIIIMLPIQAIGWPGPFEAHGISMRRVNMHDVTAQSRVLQ
jgi:hypothetical protein